MENKNYAAFEKRLNFIDGRALYYGFLAGANKIFQNQHLLNKINVFPVADADTGTNFASTMRSIIDMVEPNRDVKITADSLANAALIGARGNSGIIFAQFLYGFSTEIHPAEPLTVSSFAIALKESVKYAYQAITNPVEGTILTVIREWADFIYQVKDSINDFSLLLENSIDKAKHSLEETKLKLKVLSMANVVDAGAKAFVLFLEGIIDLLKQGIKILHTSYQANRVEELTAIVHGQITFRYCTEALISGSGIDHQKIRTQLLRMGDSLVVAGSPIKTRIHIHTDNPSEVFDRLIPHGKIVYQKVDDMVFQNTIASGVRPKVAILTDSTCDIPRSMLDEYQIHVIPLNVHFGDNYFLDGLSLSGKHFQKLFFSSKIYPSTSQPAIKDLMNRYSYLFTQYDSVISLHISSAMSGTWSNSRHAAYKIANENEKIATVIDSTKLSGSLGLLTLRAAQMALEGASHQEIVDAIDQWKEKTFMFVSCTTTKYMVKSGRLSPTKGFVANALNIKPVIIVNHQGQTQEKGKSVSERGAIKKVIASIKHIIGTGEVWNYAITHFNNLKTAQRYSNELEKLTGKPPLFISEASPVLCINAGPGTVS
ncbi:MAG TPA: fatty acid-binding protein DegV, partial [Bacteroidales bacterium]|nr:fatty acid-binding protein DegV [Bacteroidales bacterium]